MKRALCTGVAGSIGHAIASSFLHAFPDVELIGTYHSDPKTATELRAYPNFVLRQQDLAVPESWVIPREIDYLINCAGLSSGKELVAGITRSEFDELFAVNLRAPFLLMTMCLSHMAENGFGRIVNVNSIWGLRGSQRNGAYLASKHGLSGLTKAVAKDYGRSGVTSNEVCPGPVDSDMMEKIITSLALRKAISREEMLRQMLDGTNSGQFATTRQVADTVVFLCQESSSHINGASLVIDGGITC